MATWLRALPQRAGAFLWLLVLYAGLTYLAVGTIAVSQIDSRFGDQSGYIFHVADIADQQRRVRSMQVRDADQLAYQAQLQRDAALVELSAHAQRLGVSLPALKAAMNNPNAPLRLRDLGVVTDAEGEKAWNGMVGDYYRQSLTSSLALERRDKLIEEWRDGVNRVVVGQMTDGKILGGLTQSQFQAVTSTAAGLRSFGYAWLFAIPTEVLTLVLALVLGALGSTLHMTRVVIDSGERPPISWYFFRPCQGLLMALVVFVLLKAGQLTVGAGDTDTLNPFFVAFVGTVSGLLSPDAYRLVQRAGAALIPAGNDATDRWAFGLAEALNAAGADAATLADGIGARPEDVAAWVSETLPVPADQQKLVAAWLRADPRRLFTADPPLARRPAPSSSAQPLPAQ